MTSPTLTKRQAAFVAAYDGPGSGVRAARAAGYAGDDSALAVVASKLLALAKVVAAIKARGEDDLPRVARELIADRSERQALWTAILRNPSEKTGDRLKAAELLGRSEGDFLERVAHEGKVSLEALVAASYKVPVAAPVDDSPTVTDDGAGGR